MFLYEITLVAPCRFDRRDLSGPSINGTCANCGSGDPNATVTISEGANTLGTTTANGSGAWSFTPSGLADGSHALVATETDINGSGTASVTFTLDQTAPTVVITSAAGLTNQPNQTIAGTVSDPNDLPANATLSDDNGKLSGTFGSQLGEVPVSGTAEGKALKLTLVAQTPQGDMTVTMTGDLDGDNIVNGKAEVSGLGQMEWSAKRIKQ